MLLLLPSRGTLLIFQSYSLQKSSLRELHKKYLKYHLKYQGSKGLVSSFFPKCIWAAERRGQVTPSNYTDEALSPKRLRQLQKVFSISLRESVPHIITIRDYLQRNVSLSISLGLNTWKNLSLELVWLFEILFHILLKLPTYLIFVK